MLLKLIKRVLIYLEYYIVSALLYTIVKITKSIQYIKKKWKNF